MHDTNCWVTSRALFGACSSPRHELIIHKQCPVCSSASHKDAHLQSRIQLAVRQKFNSHQPKEPPLCAAACRTNHLPGGFDSPVTCCFMNVVPRNTVRCSNTPSPQLGQFYSLSPKLGSCNHYRSDSNRTCWKDKRFNLKFISSNLSS